MRTCTVLAFALSLILFAPTAFAQDAVDAPEVVEVDVVEDAPVEVSEDGSAEGSAEAPAVVIDSPTEVPETYDDVEDSVIALVAAGKAQEWAIFAGILLMILVWAARKFVFTRVSGPVVPWATAATGTLAYVAIALATGVPVLSAIFTGFLTGATATGLWELLGRQVLDRS